MKLEALKTQGEKGEKRPKNAYNKLTLLLIVLDRP